MPDIKLNFINNSHDRNNSRIVIFQKNEATDFEELAVAWKVIENCGHGWRHPFTYPMQMFVSASDSWGNYSDLIEANNGQQFAVRDNGSGDILTSSGPASSHTEVEVLNGLDLGAIDAKIFKDGRLLAVQTGIAPGQKAVFEFKPTLWIGTASRVEEGQLINSAILSSINTQLSLFGIKSADVVMTGGGPGSASAPFEFTLQNIQYA